MTFSLKTISPGSDVPEWSQSQREAATWLAQGKKISESARRVGVSRETIRLWLKMPEYAAYVAEEKDDFIRGLKDRQLTVALKLEGKALEAFESAEKIQVRSAKDLASIAQVVRTSQDLQRQAVGVRSVDAVDVNVTAVASASAQSDVQIGDLDRFVTEDLGIPEEEIYPRVLWVLRQIDRPNVRRAYLMIGKGGGKSAIAEISLARSAQRLCAMVNPSRRFNLRSGKTLGVVNLSAAGAEQANVVIFGDLRRDVASSPWFRSHAKPEDLKGTIRFPQNVIAVSGSSSALAQEGVEVFAAAVDEVSGMPEVRGEPIAARELVDPVEQTQVSRFPQDGKLVVISWPRHKRDYMNREIDRRLAVEPIAEDLTADFLASPLTRRGPEEDARRREAFRSDPFAGIPVRVLVTTKGTLVIQSPVWEMKPDADLEALRDVNAKDPRLFAAMHAASPKEAASSPFILDLDAVKRGADPNLHHPLDENGRFFPWFRGREDALYFAHIDVGVREDSLGIAVGHYEDGIFVFDFLHEMRPEEGAKIDLAKAREFLFVMAEQRDFTFGKITFDSYLGEAMQQEFEGRGLPCAVQSVDRNRLAYDEWRGRLRDGNLRYYAYEPMFECCADLIDLDRKVDHREGGKKDVTDAMAAVVHSIVHDALGEV